MPKRKQTGLRPAHPVPGSSTRQTEDRIVASARRLLARHGPSAFTMRDVADGAGITIGAIYKHFRSREALLDRVVRDALSVLEVRMLRAIAPLPPGSLDRIAALGREYVRVAEEHPEEFKVMFSPDRRAPVPIEQLPDMAGYGIVRQCVLEAIASGTFRPVDPDLLAFFFWSRAHGVVMLLAACDFSSVLMPDGLPLTPQIALEMTREFATVGLGRVVPRQRPIPREPGAIEAEPA